MLKCNVDVTFRTALSEEISHASRMLKSFFEERFTRAGVITEKLALLPKSAELHGSANSVDSKALVEVLSSKSAGFSDLDHDAPPNLGTQAAKVISLNWINIGRDASPKVPRVNLRGSQRFYIFLPL